MEEVGWWEDPREGFILTKPYMARRHVRQTKLPGVREQLFFSDSDGRCPCAFTGFGRFARVRACIGLSPFARMQFVGFTQGALNQSSPSEFNRL